MKIAFDGPMAAGGLCKLSGAKRKGADAGALYGLDFVATLNVPLDHSDRGQQGRAGAPEPSRIGRLPQNQANTQSASSLAHLSITKPVSVS